MPPAQRRKSRAVAAPVAGSSEARAVNMSREAALAFLEADVNGDGVLEWHEFRDAIARLRKHEGCAIAMGDAFDDETALKDLFNSIDHDKSGTIDIAALFESKKRD
jgi:Ca2+-binding EF-hand superfamily protein